MFSFKYHKNEKITPRGIAVIQGGKYNGKIIYFYSDVKHIPKDDLKDDFTKHIEIFDGIMYPIPNTNESQRDIICIAGGSGLGKSTLSGSILEIYQAIYPDRPIYIFSKVKADPSIDDLKLKNVQRILLDNTFLEGEPLDCNDFKKSIVLFDDVSTLSGELLKSVLLLRDDLMCTARHTETTMICTCHLLMNYKETKVQLLESTMFTVFPKSNTYQMQRFCRVYMGMSNAAIKNALNLKSRHITFIKTYPPIVLTQHEIMLLEMLDPDIEQNTDTDTDDSDDSDDGGVVLKAKNKKRKVVSKKKTIKKR
jgi:hypothetical protein